jgi:primosomal protein N'
MKTIYKCLRGSYAQGVTTPTSDKDYFEIVLPPIEAVLGLQEMVGSQHIKNGIDIRTITLKEFLRQALHGRSTELEVLFAKPEHQTEVKAVATWHEKGGILLATERIIPYLPEEIPMVAIASVDSFLSIPEYTASERAFTLLVELRSRASELFLVQTRDPAHRVMRALREGTGNAFYKEELADRERFGYPPYATLIRFTSSGKKEMVEKEIESIAKALAHMAPIRMEGKATSRAHVRMHILLRLPQGSWIDQRLLRFIRTLPPTIEIRINPTSLHSN